MDGPSGAETARAPQALRTAIELSPTLESPRQARRFLSAALDGVAEDDLLDTALLLTTELVTNAVVHAGTAAAVELTYDDRALTVRVVDRHPHRIPTPSTPDAATSEGGRGLALVEALATRWGTEHWAGGKAVWFQLDGTDDDTVPRTRPVAVPDLAAEPEVPLAPRFLANSDPARRTSEHLLGRLSPLDGITELLHRLLDALPLTAVAVRRTGEAADVAALGPVGRGPNSRLPLDSGDRLVGELTLWPDTAFTGPERTWLELVAGRLALALRIGELRGAEERRTGILSFLAEASDLLAGTLDVGHALALLAQLPVPRLAEWATVQLVDDAEVTVVSHRVEGDSAAVRDRLADPAGPLAGLISQALRTGHLAAVTLDGTDADGAAESVVAAPLRARRRVLGTLTVGRTGDSPYLGDELDLLADLARRAALAIDNARLYQEQTHVAQALQTSLLPAELPELAGLDLGASYRAAGEGLDVGGDFYDVAPGGSGTWTLSIGDVCGKGAEAAAMTGVARDVLRLLHREGRALPDALRQLNRTLRDQGARSRFCTVAVARLRAVAAPGGDAAGCGVTVSLCLAGHPQPVLLRASGEASLVGTPGTLLGLLDEDSLALSEVEVRLEPGDALVFYTDGVTETRAGSELFGEPRLLRTVSGSAGRPAQRIADDLRAAASRFAANGLRDDLAVLVVRVAR